MSQKSEYTMSAQELIQEVLRLRALEKQLLKERGELMARNQKLEDWTCELQGVIDNNGYPSGTDYDAAIVRAEAAEARVRELEAHSTMLSQIAGHVAHLCGPDDTTLDGVRKIEARLAAVLGAADAMKRALRRAQNDHGYVSDADTSIRAYDAARTGDAAK